MIVQLAVTFCLSVFLFVQATCIRFLCMGADTEDSRFSGLEARYIKTNCVSCAVVHLQGCVNRSKVIILSSHNNLNNRKAKFSK